MPLDTMPMDPEADDEMSGASEAIDQIRDMLDQLEAQLMVGEKQEPESPGAMPDEVA